MILLKNQFKLKRISDAQLSSKNERKTESPVSYFRQENIEKKKEIIEENKKKRIFIVDYKTREAGFSLFGSNHSKIDRGVGCKWKN